jgi:hypothetical protein
MQLMLVFSPVLLTNCSFLPGERVKSNFLFHHHGILLEANTLKLKPKLVDLEKLVLPFGCI